MINYLQITTNLHKVSNIFKPPLSSSVGVFGHLWTKFTVRWKNLNKLLLELAIGGWGCANSWRSIHCFWIICWYYNFFPCISISLFFSFICHFYFLVVLIILFIFWVRFVGCSIDWNYGIISNYIQNESKLVC